MIRVGAYFQEDFDALEIANAEMIGDLTALKNLILPENARTGFDGSEAVCSAGVVQLWPGVGQGWVIVDKDIKDKLG